MTSRPLLELQNLQLSIASKPILYGSSFSLMAGETVGLVGESGSGKSITALAILRLLPNSSHISAGDILLDGKSLLSLTESEMQSVRGNRIGMIFQEPAMALNPVLSIGKQVGEALTTHRDYRAGALRKKVLSLLEEVQLPEPDKRIDWYPHQLSGGQKQRVMIAISLACEPKMLIADEPTTALDVTVQAQILILLKNLTKQRQMSLLLITHDMGIVANMCDKVVVMRDGIILEKANCTQFLKQPEHEYSINLLKSLPSTSDFRPPLEILEPILNVQNLSVRFPVRKGFFKRTTGYTEAVRTISFTLHQRETIAIVGESGSGKTTAGKALLRLLDGKAKISGDILFQQHPLHRLTQSDMRPLRQHLQIIFQDPFSSLNPRLTIGETLKEGIIALKLLSSARDITKRCDELMRMVQLSPDMLERYPHEFSGGQRQRVAIARALSVDPKVIICDEPTSALDVSVRQQILTLLAQLQKEMQLSLLFITHDLTLVPHIAHRIIVMRDGEIVETGTTEEILTRPAHPYTQELIKAIPAFTWQKH